MNGRETRLRSFRPREFTKQPREHFRTPYSEDEAPPIADHKAPAPGLIY